MIDIAQSLADLRIPPKFKPTEVLDSSDAAVVNWNKAVQSRLRTLEIQVIEHQIDLDSIETKGHIVSAVAALDGTDAWIQSETRELSLKLLSHLVIDVAVVQAVLERHIKPIFQANTHPFINTSSGRTLPRAAGGPMAAQDHYDDQTWKDFPGVDNVVSWCIGNISLSSFEFLWHLVIPPVMAFIDDYKAPYKLKGAHLVARVLDRAPNELLKRTGIGQLLLTSLSTTLAYLHDDATPDLIRAAVPITIHLIDMMFGSDSVERFDKLSHLLGESIIGGIWVYASRDESTIKASFDVLPNIVQALGIGTTRYLTALIPQCLHCIKPDEFKRGQNMLQLQALNALLAIMEHCQPRLYLYKGSIIDGVGRCWVTLHDTGSQVEELPTFQQRIQKIFALLAQNCPSVLTDEYRQLMSTEPDIFQKVL